MKTLWFAIAFLFVVLTATAPWPTTALAQEQTCDAQIRTANAMMEELQEQIRLMSARAAQFHGNLSVQLNDVSSELITTRFKLEQLKKSVKEEN